MYYNLPIFLRLPTVDSFYRELVIHTYTVQQTRNTSNSSVNSMNCQKKPSKWLIVSVIHALSGIINLVGYTR